MASNSKDSHDPKGFTPRSSRAASEYAREQGWQLNEEERTKSPETKQPYDGGMDYDYGARDFGDSPEDTSSARPRKPTGQLQAKAIQKMPKKKTA